MGRLKKTFIKKNCNFCGLCEAVCPVDAIKIDKEKQELVFLQDKCIGCGDCVYVCPTEAWVKRLEGYTVYIGGKMGKFPKLGIKVFDFIETKEQLFEIIDKTLEFYKKEGIKGERFRETLDRVGLEKYHEAIK
ncbi:MAG: 4Fe-4S binding protein, partial [Candidatus Omnitrophica bacterium]|nr:4Fe-4S binding protein [Candidatus Omnitrophota bacterium]